MNGTSFLAIDDWPVWTAEHAPWLDSRFDASVLARFNGDAEPDWIEWLDQEQAKLDGRLQSSVELFQSFLKATYAGVRTFHATRLSSLTAIAEQGLRAWTPDELRQQARKAFADLAANEAIEEALNGNFPNHRGNRVYTFASLAHVFDLPSQEDGEIPHFLRAGSEWLYHVAGHLGINRSHTGRAYIIACDLPWALLEPDAFAMVARNALLNIIIRRFFDPSSSNMHGDSCIATQASIPSAQLTLVSDVEHLMAAPLNGMPALSWMTFQEALDREKAAELPVLPN